MQDHSYIPFTKEMKDYTILAPNMLPMHFKLVLKVAETYGLHFKLLETASPQIIQTGLRYTHNDACYPAICVIGQFIDALQSGQYDTHKTALIMFQTGGGCRASNYMSLIRKALERAGFGYVPVISFSFAGVEKHPGFQLTLPQLRGMAYGLLFGDLLMSLKNQVRPYEKHPGEADTLAESWIARLSRELGNGRSMTYRRIKNEYREIIHEFSAIPVNTVNKPRVGIVGQIFVEYSPLANNHLEDFLVREGAEVVSPCMMDFMLYTIYNSLISYRLYHTGGIRRFGSFLAYRYLCRKKNEIIRIVKTDGHFHPWTPFEKITTLADEFISPAVKMGEGWLLTAEIMEYARDGISNVVCTQPFGCLPNHIVARGMMKPIKEKYPNINIVAVDYDASASSVNQENRLKLMLANSRG